MPLLGRSVIRFWCSVPPLIALACLWAADSRPKGASWAVLLAPGAGFGARHSRLCSPPPWKPGDGHSGFVEDSGSGLVFRFYGFSRVPIGWLPTGLGPHEACISQGDMSTVPSRDAKCLRRLTKLVGCSVLVVVCFMLPLGRPWGTLCRCWADRCYVSGALCTPWVALDCLWVANSLPKGASWTVLLAPGAGFGVHRCRLCSPPLEARRWALGFCRGFWVGIGVQILWFFPSAHRLPSGRSKAT